ncbi:type IV secretory system conjugative DNA transfer family protein [Lacipirellula parvula]|uniref:TraD/TraG TraM recognition site domain-containing protein n=1 Tax=Lacipirellula parvula TaxID=2650471 RepID=A0A5K7XCR2_9BACT|nr:TraM recognition domain-containing protein [Lacipirellula parvula]BBO34165.1 hypothetical protein PLANPX_3777 [Lacipirellula parvula]
MLYRETLAPEQTLWQRIQSHKESSTRIDQRRSITFGIDPKTNAVISVPAQLFYNGHAVIFGSTGSGKTTGTLLPAVLQFIRGHRDITGAWAPKNPVFVFDLKGDNGFFHAVKRAAENDNRSFRHLSCEPGNGYYFLDPFEFISPKSTSALTLASDWIRSLGLDNGIVYGGQYFTAQNFVLLKQAFKDMLRVGGQLSIGTLAIQLARRAREKGNADAKHISLCLDTLAEYPQINLSAHAAMPSQRIDFADAIEKGDVVYFHLELNQTATSLREVAAIALTTLIQAAKLRRRKGLPKKSIHVVVDEFFHIAGKAFGDLLSTCRAWGIQFVLATQYLTQLKTHDRDLPDGVLTNTAIKQFYSGATPEEIEFLRDESGKARDLKYGKTTSRKGDGYSTSETDGWFLDEDAIRAVSDEKMHSVLLVNDGLTYGPGTRTRICRALYPILIIEHLRFDNEPLPNYPNGDLADLRPWNTADASPPSSAKSKASKRTFTDEELLRDDELQSRMESLHTALTA